MSDRIEKLHAWIETRLGSNTYELVPASEDASFRRYYRLRHDDTTSIIMDAPPDREDCRPFIDIARRLQAAGVHVPDVMAVDSLSGFVQLSDLGDVLYLDRLGDDTADTLYSEAISALLRFQRHGDVTGLPDYGSQRLLEEMNLFNDWLVDRHLGLRPDGSETGAMLAVFDCLVSNAQAQPQVFVHRDYHSRNLMVFPGNNPGIIDFQDAVRGPVTYDLVSLLKDCYIKWPRNRVITWARQFYQHHFVNGPDWDQFIRWFDLMGVQRHLKASGIFARLYHRDHKPGFLQDIPRTLSYITDLKGDYPELEFLISFIHARIDPVLAKVNKQCAP